MIAKRQTTPLFGLGLIEAIPDRADRGVSGRGDARAPRARRDTSIAWWTWRAGPPASGRFGWKSQQATLLSFSGDAYVNEMGVTSRLFPAENAPNGDMAKLASCDKVADFEDHDDDIVLFTNFMRLLAPPPRERARFRDHADHDSRMGAAEILGEQLFERVGCEVCHHSGFRAVSADSGHQRTDGRRLLRFPAARHRHR